MRARFLAVLASAALTVVLLAPAAVLAAGEQDLVGKNVVVLMNTESNASSVDVVEDLRGTVKSATVSGVILACETRTLVTAGRRASAPYKADLFIPWTSVLYMKAVAADAK